MRGVYLVAAELSARGLIVSPTSRSAAGADLLVTDESCNKAFSVQVKTNAKPVGFWLVGIKARQVESRTHIYVFVNLQDRTGTHDFYVVPSAVVRKSTKEEKRPRSTWFALYRRDIERYRDRWRLLGA
jgi:hypothetical protein